MTSGDPVPSTPAHGGRLARLATLGLPFSRPSVAYGTIVAVLCLVVLIQILLQTGGRNDDAELLLFSQTLAWGYDPLNPPLVVWLHWVLVQVLTWIGALPTTLGWDPAPLRTLAADLGLTPNVGLLSTRLLIALMLISAYPLARAATRVLTDDDGMATLSGLSLAALVAWAWAPQINLAHTVAMTVACFALLAVTLRLARAPTWSGFILLGVVTGLALLTKYNIILMVAATLLAALATASTRAVLRDTRVWLSVALAAVIAAPHYLWLLLHWDSFQALAASKLGLRDTETVDGMIHGLAALGEHTLMVLLPGVALALLLFWRAVFVRPTIGFGTGGQRRDLMRFAGLVPMLFLVLMAALVPVAGVTDFNPHHPYPVMLVVVPLFAWLSRGRITETARGLFGLICVTLTLVVPLAMAQMILRTAHSCQFKCNTALPYVAWADDLQTAGFQGGTVLVLGSVHHMPLEALRTSLPDARLLRPADHQKAGFAPPALATPADCLILWPADTRPDTLAHLRDDGLPGQAPGTRLPDSAVTGTLHERLAISGRPAPPLGYALVQGGIGTCR